MTLPIEIRDSQFGASFAVRIYPNAVRAGITGTQAGALKLAVSAPPVNGQANEALVEFLAQLFHVRRSAVQILGGAHSRNKVVRIDGRSAGEVQLALRESLTV